MLPIYLLYPPPRNKKSRKLMKLNWLSVLGVVIALFFFAMRGLSIPVPALDLDRLTQDASFIAVGKITTVEELGKTTVPLGNQTFAAREMVAELHVDRVLKGNAASPYALLRFHFSRTDDFLGFGSVTASSYRIFFLHESSGELRPASPYYPSLVAVPDAVPHEIGAIDQVIAELNAVVESTRAPVQERREAVYALDSTKNPAAVHALKRVTDVQDLGLRLSVAATLLHHNDISTLRLAEQTLLKPDPTIPRELLLSLSYAIRDGVKDERAVPTLGKLLQASDVDVRRAASSSLMHTGSSSSIDLLLGSLTDPDFEVRYYCAIALAEITGQTEWRPNMDDFKSDERKYVNHWHDWSKSR